jgi:hypothetical protein
VKTCERMQRIIGEIAAKHGLDLEAPEAHLRLEMPPYEPLVIEKVGRHLVSVAHYYCQNGDAIADPDVVFFTGYSEWVPVEVTLPPPGGYRVYARVSPDGAEITEVDLRGQAELARFVERLWAHNLDGQGWVEGGEPRAARDVSRYESHNTRGR